MNKKVSKVLLVPLAMLCMGLPNVNAKEFTISEINEMSKFDENAYDTIYVFGSHVYFNKITMANLVAAANTLNGKTDAILYYKDGSNTWKNAVTNEQVDVSNVTFDISMITKETTDDTITGNEEDPLFVKTVKNGNSLSEIYALETGVNLNFKGARIADPNSEKIGDAIKEAHTYNQNALNVTFDSASLTIEEKTPLVKYNNGYDEGEWFGLLVDLGKEISKDKLKVQLYNIYDEEYYDYTVEEIDIIDAKNHGATGNEFIIWLRGDIKNTTNSSIIFTEYDENKNIIGVNHVKFNYVNKISIYDRESKEEIKSTTDNVEVSRYKVSEDTYKYMFYTTDSGVTEFTFTDGDKDFVAKYNEGNWSVYEPIDVTSVKLGFADIIVEEKEEHSWNQGAIAVSDFKESTEEGIDYVVTITKNKEMISYNNPNGTNAEWYSLIVDLGIDPNALTSEGYKIEEVDITDAHSHGATTYSGFVMWLQGNNKERVVTFTNSLEQTDKIVVKFVVEDKVPELSADIKLSSADLELYDDAETNDDHLIANNSYKYNMNSLSMIQTYDSKTDTYNVIVKANRELKEVYKYKDTSTLGKWYGLVLDFGEEIEESDVVFDTSNTTIMVDASVDKEYTFTSKNTKDTIKVNVKTIEVSTLKDEIEGTVTIADEYKDKVSYEVTDLNGDNIEKNFIISEGITRFGFSVEKDGKTTNYTYAYTELGWEKVESLKLVNVYKGLVLTEYNDEQKYNQDAIKSVSVDGNVINIVFNRILSKKVVAGNDVTSNWYSIVVDLDVLNTKLGTTDDCGYSIEDADITDANRHVEESNQSDNNLVLWLKAEETDANDGKTITFVNKDNTDITYDVVIKSTYEEDDALELTEAKVAVISEELKDDDYYEDIKNNNEGLTVGIDNENENTVIITTDKPLKKYKNASGLETEEAWFGILVDLGIDSKYVSTVTDGYKIEEVDKDSVHIERFKGDTNDIILWLRESRFEGENKEFTITFTNLTENNKYNTLDVTFKFKEEIEPLKLNSVRMADAVNIGDNTEIHSLNQSKIDVELSENNIIVTKEAGTGSYNNGHNTGTWFSVLVDFGIDPKTLTSEEYQIEEIDITDAHRHGATGTEFLLWLSVEDFSENSKTITFKNTYNESTLNVNVKIADETE